MSDDLKKEVETRAYFGSLMLIGASAAVFGARQARRIQREMDAISHMWSKKTTIQYHPRYKNLATRT